MNKLSRKSIKTTRGFSYVYFSSPASPGKPTIFLLHGWPNDATLWDDLTSKHLVPAGYGVVVPDCLGYGNSDKPTDPKAYGLKGLTNDFAEILDAERIDKVIVGGHDSGAAMTSKFWNFKPERCIGMLTLNVAVQPKPDGPFDLDKIKALMEKFLGYFPFEYMYLYSDPIEGPALLDAHPEPLFTALHMDPPEDRKKVNCAPDGLKKWLKADNKGPVQSYATDEMRQMFVERMRREGFTSTLANYRAPREGVWYEDEKDLPNDRYVVRVPYLFIGASRDVICLPQAIEQPKQMGLVPQLTLEIVDAGHWCMLAEPQKVGEIITRWLSANDAIFST